MWSVKLDPLEPSAVRIPAKPQPRLGRSRINNILRIGFRRTLSLGTALSASLFCNDPLVEYAVSAESLHPAVCTQ